MPSQQTQQAVVPYQPSSGRQILEMGGGMLGSAFGPLGGMIGKGLGSLGASILGLGDYKINKNIFLNGRLPEFKNRSEGGGTVIRFQEYLGDIISSSVAGQFNIQEFDINPALSQTFPWLSQIAMNYEQYSFEGLVFCFKSTSADSLNSTNTALGTVIMATNYDSSDPAFASKGEMMNYEFSSSCKPSETCLHMIECAPKQSVLSELYTRPGTVPSGDDQRMYDLGKFQIATTGLQGTSVSIGELHVTYQVRLLKPKLFVSIGEEINFYHATNANYSSASPLGTANTIAAYSGNNLSVTVAPTTITFPLQNVVQNYRIEFNWIGSVASAGVAYPVFTVTNGTLDDNLGAPQAALAGSTIMMYAISLKTTGNSTVPVLTLSGAGVFPTGTQVLNINICQQPNSCYNYTL